MSVQLDLPFARGTTFFGSNTPDTSVGVYLEGKEYMVPDTGQSQTSYPAGGRNDGAYLILRCVRNTSTIALAPKRLVRFATSGIYGCRVDGYAGATGDGELSFPVDDAYGATGSGTTTIQVNDLFYIVVKGYCLISTGSAAGARTSISVGDPLMAQTAAASTSTTAGRIGECDFSGATTPLATNILGMVGRAVTASTTNQTNTDTLVRVGVQW